MQAYLEPLLKPDYNWNKFSKEMLLGSRDVQYVAQMLPRQLHWFFKRFAANGYALEVKNSGAELDRALSEKNNRAIVLGLALRIFSRRRPIRGSYFHAAPKRIPENRRCDPPAALGLDRLPPAFLSRPHPDLVRYPFHSR
jgi:hypothetical protein